MRAQGNPTIRNRFRQFAVPVALLLAPVAALAATGRVPQESGILELYWTGGVFMHPILLCSVIGLALILERIWFFARARTDTERLMTELLRTLQDQGLDAAQRMLHARRGPIAAVLHSGLARAKRGPEAVEKAIQTAASIEVALLERGLIWLSTVANIAPLLGFLGTVSGMIHAFEAIAAAEEVSARLVATGIYEALITTAAGLIVAIPVQAAHNYFVSRIDKVVIDLEESGAELIDALTIHSKQWEHFLNTIHTPGASAPR
ncbi:MAG TPA: MotA/TolQ/ExbB proton channel family protein [Candidatus Eisenbacteria bacterium]|jgi:biopolymer transport protein ExbB|nr:MotA/TolQ/ExbB proton channel family protein [Candidatus Eisenbacteria bacterium]